MQTSQITHTRKTKQQHYSGFYLDYTLMNENEAQSTYADYYCYSVYFIGEAGDFVSWQGRQSVSAEEEVEEEDEVMLRVSWTDRRSDFLNIIFTVLTLCLLLLCTIISFSILFGWLHPYIHKYLVHNICLTIIAFRKQLM